MKKVELLAPAGDLEKFKTAIQYGADAVYLAGDKLGLRTASKNFSLDDIKEATKIAHDLDKKIYLTLNVISHNKDLEGVDEYIQSLDEAGVDAFIVSDPGIFQKVKTLAPSKEIHISTQANITNTATVEFWKSLGADRVILARELSLEEIKEIKDEVRDSIMIEAFVHGAMCMSYSGRCLLSNFMTGRSANMGDCAHPCRYKYYLMEETRPGEYYPITEDEKGSYIMNSKDLCMINYIPELIEAGVDSFKIEGRVKSEYYVATVINQYRRAIDDYYEDIEKYKYNRDNNIYLEEIMKVSHRDFTTAFFFGDVKEASLTYDNSSYIRLYDFIARVLDYDEDKKLMKVQERNKFSIGDEVEIFGPKFYDKFTINKIYDENMNEVDNINTPMKEAYIPYDKKVEYNYMIRRKANE
ncbi:peptidase U32 family protein [Fenollaria massiliensis]|uniref:U32 family peptidase n=1 Tax=Fenollaria massiliensis TaxID=938288 RepID=A0A9E7DKB0_9FIRM|nr:U32 family peptidase [Fenollaria massiliensis]UQK59757.1 U32 family peptidase [Fenollaria massiliensis]